MFSDYAKLYLQDCHIPMVQQLSSYTIYFVIIDEARYCCEVANGKTAWAEMLEIIAPAIDLLGSLCPDGVRLRFLNNPEACCDGVRSFEQVKQFFSALPRTGHGRCLDLLRKVFSECKDSPNALSKVFLAMPGPPADSTPHKEMRKAHKEFREVLTKDRQIRFCTISILLNTNNEGYAHLFRCLDKEIDALDVTDDLEATREAAKRVKRKKHRMKGLFGMKTGATDVAHMIDFKYLLAKFLCEELDDIDG